MQRSSTWILKSLWGACERWSKSDCVDLSAAFAYYTLQSFFPILLISLSIASWFLGKQEGLDQQIITIAAQILPPSVVELVETTLFNLFTYFLLYLIKKFFKQFFIYDATIFLIINCPMALKFQIFQ